MDPWITLLIRRENWIEHSYFGAYFQRYNGEYKKDIFYKMEKSDIEIPLVGSTFLKNNYRNYNVKMNFTDRSQLIQNDV